MAEWPSVDEVVMPDEMADFRTASHSELTALLQEAAASTLTTDLVSAARNALS